MLSLTLDMPVDSCHTQSHGVADVLSSAHEIMCSLEKKIIGMTSRCIGIIFIACFKSFSILVSARSLSLSLYPALHPLNSLFIFINLFAVAPSLFYSSPPLSPPFHMLLMTISEAHAVERDTSTWRP